MASSAVVTAPLAAPPAYGLLAAAETSDSTVRWQHGTTWESESCEIGGVLPIECEGNTALMDPADDFGPGVVEAAPPFVVFARDVCSAMTRGRDWDGRARRRLEATQSYLVAREFWGGALAGAEPGASGAYLTAPGAADMVTAAAVSPTAALACVEGGLAETMFGARGMIHVRAGLLAHLAAANLVELRGNQWYSPGGHVVVPDAGYPGSGPATAGVDPEVDPPVVVPPTGAHQWMYGTGPVRVRLGVVETYGPAADLGAVLDRQVNTITAYSYRPVIVEWEPCTLVGAQVNIGMCA